MDVSNGSGPATAFYSVADRRFFLGLVAMLNSLRMAGHDEPLVVVDAGLTPRQRDLLAGHVTFVRVPPASLSHYLFVLSPRELPADVMVLIDADMIVTRRLTELVEAARADRVVAFVDCPANSDRFSPRWAPALGLGEARRQPYVNAGLVAFSRKLSRRLLPPWADGQARLAVGDTCYGGAQLADPFYFADQDVLNALLSTCFAPDELAFVDHRFAPHPPFTGLELRDTRTLDCRYGDGAAPFVLHHVLAKPWLEATRRNIYSALLPRLLLAPDVTLRLDAHMLPLRLREGRVAALDRQRADVKAMLSASAGRGIHHFGIRTRLRDARAARRTAA
ncbi:hypothetical protein [Streptomyces aquilus]|uniref:hypothetical protein n=1 Tax=Streptomyces aquilus TaxID=2548456 RepID=UPI0036A649C5